VVLDFYNRFQGDVWEPAFRLAEAMHTVQDSFAHTIRSEADDLKKIATVLNYVDAISTDFNAERDGLRTRLVRRASTPSKTIRVRECEGIVRLRRGNARWSPCAAADPALEKSFEL
jgi:hypothetical protein